MLSQRVFGFFIFRDPWVCTQQGVHSKPRMGEEQRSDSKNREVRSEAKDECRMHELNPLGDAKFSLAIPSAYKIRREDNKILDRILLPIATNFRGKFEKSSIR